jgi:hypothetical protein
MRRGADWPVLDSILTTSTSQKRERPVEFASVGEVRAILTTVADTIEQDAGHADAVRQTTEHIQAQLDSTWAGSQRDEASTALAYAHTVVETVTTGLQASAPLCGASAQRGNPVLAPCRT